MVSLVAKGKFFKTSKSQNIKTSKYYESGCRNIEYRVILIFNNEFWTIIFGM